MNTKSSRRTAFALIVMVLNFDIIISKPTKRPNFVTCANSDECGLGACCVLGMDRFPTPSCLPYPGKGSYCWPLKEGPFNSTVTYPNDLKIIYTNVHRETCPCSNGLDCSKEAHCIPVSAVA